MYYIFTPYNNVLDQLTDTPIRNYFKYRGFAEGIEEKEEEEEEEDGEML